MHLIEALSTSCGLKISDPYIYEKYCTLNCDKYIIIETNNIKNSAQDYDYWQDSINLILESLNKNNIKIIQLCGEKDQRLLNSHTVINLNYNQKAFLIRNSLLYIGSNTFGTRYSKLEDKDLLILLGGIKELAQIRGYTKVEYKVVSATETYFATSCKITWIPNYETYEKEIVFESLADATLNNTKSFARFFLAAIAENRAFVRCVRNFLKINIVSQEELGDAKLLDEVLEKQENPTSPQSLLDKLMKEKNISFEVIKDRLVKEKFENSESIASIQDIPKSKIFELISRIKKSKNNHN